MKKAQSSIEYLIIIGIALLVITPLSVFTANYLNNYQQELTSQRLYATGEIIIDAAQSVYYQGEPAKRTLTINLNKKLEVAQVSNRELVFIYKSSAGDDSITVPSPINLTGSLPTRSGKHIIEVEARDDGANIEVVS